MALWTPAEITTALWLDAADAGTITDAGAGAVSDWADKSGNARDFTQATAGSRPTTGATTQNGLNVLDFAGDFMVSVDALAEWNFLHDGTEYEIFAVIKHGTVADPNTLYGLLGNTGGSSASRRGVSFYWDDRASQSKNETYIALVSNGGSTFPARVSVEHTTANGFYPANTFNLVGLYLDPDNATAADRSFARNNGGTADATNIRTGAISALDASYSALNIGALGLGAFPLTGSIAELLIIARTEVTADRQIVEGYLAWKWGLEANLPSGHPYEFAAPTTGDPLAITTQPTNQSVVEGQTTAFTVVAEGGDGTITYQWKRGEDDSAISGETAATYDFTTAIADNGKTFYVTVADDVDSIDSDTVTLTVNEAMSILTQPADQAVQVGQNATFTVVVQDADDTPTYQWHKVTDGTPALLVGETAESLTFTVTAADYETSYYVVIDDGVTELTSISARLFLAIGKTYGLDVARQRGPIFHRGAIVFESPVTEGTGVLVRRKTPIVNDFLAEALKPFQPEQFENQIDRYTMILQEIEGDACACPPESYPIPGVDIPGEIDPGAFFPVDTDIPEECRGYSCDAFFQYLTRKADGGTAFNYIGASGHVLAASYDLGNGYTLVPTNDIGQPLSAAVSSSPYQLWRMDQVFPKCGAPGQLVYGLRKFASPSGGSVVGFTIQGGAPQSLAFVHSGGFGTSDAFNGIYQISVVYTVTSPDGGVPPGSQFPLSIVWNNSQGFGAVLGAEVTPTYFGFPVAGFGSINFMSVTIDYEVFISPHDTLPPPAQMLKVNATASVNSNGQVFTRSRTFTLTSKSNGITGFTETPGVSCFRGITVNLATIAGVTEGFDIDEAYTAFLRNFPSYENPAWCPV